MNKEIIEKIEEQIRFDFPDASKEKIRAEIRKKFEEIKQRKLQSLFKQKEKMKIKGLTAHISKQMLKLISQPRDQF